MNQPHAVTVGPFVSMIIVGLGAIFLGPHSASAQSSADRLRDSAVESVRRGDYRSAIVDSTHAIELNPELVRAYLVRCYARQTLGYYDDAIADCTRAIEIDPKLAPT
jgi:tetratricopeptide (TPR) repeat protein